jgi:hypothetical protein
VQARSNRAPIPVPDVDGGRERFGVVVQPSGGSGQACGGPLVFRGGGCRGGEEVGGVGKAGDDGEFGTGGSGEGLVAAVGKVDEGAADMGGCLIQVTDVDGYSGVDEGGERGRAAAGGGDLRGAGPPQLEPLVVAAEAVGESDGADGRRHPAGGGAPGPLPGVPHGGAVAQGVVEGAGEYERWDELAGGDVGVMADQLVAEDLVSDCQCGGQVTDGVLPPR